MLNNYGMYQGYNVEGTAEVKVTPEMSGAMDSNTCPMPSCPPACPAPACPAPACSMHGCNSLPGVVCPPVFECPQERCIHREVFHEVPHVWVKSETFIAHIDTKQLNGCFLVRKYYNCWIRIDVLIVMKNNQKKNDFFV